ncbi:hypothetical protein JKA74_10985 [Marivirga sp. S37H4]|uniref:Uncharacterized protein n=1 Tax=Marivirga aurantiaca TaxID=2802615 RepID=A0A934WYK3_9BACT|nr:hypothetical protein [Marivirga aurantiaca]MBK6265563.1 hypothetical protein [Marivirga aurantiaca]
MKKPLKSIGLALVLGIFTITAGFASNLHTEDKEKLPDPKKTATSKDPVKKTIKTDSLTNYNKETKSDSITVHKAHNPSSMSSMSYNILFQVIYRYSFSEIFDSPSGSEIVTD